MRNIIFTLVLVTAMLVTSMGPVLAQDGTQVYAPYLSGEEPVAEGSSTDEQVLLPQLSSLQGATPIDDDWATNTHGRVTPEERERRRRTRPAAGQAEPADGTGVSAG